MRPLLIVFNPRQIDECVASIERLDVDQVWLTGYHEAELTGLIADVVQHGVEYSHFLVVSDDGVVPQFALDAVLAGLVDHPVVTGYCNLDVNDMRVNLTRSPFRSLERSVMEDYDLYHLSDVVGWPDAMVPTHFAGFALTGMSRDLWLEFPYRSVEGPSDWCLARRLQDADVPIVAPRAGFLWHVKERVNQGDVEPRKRLLVGHVEPCVRWRTEATASLA